MVLNNLFFQDKIYKIDRSKRFNPKTLKIPTTPLISIHSENISKNGPRRKTVKGSRHPTGLKFDPTMEPPPIAGYQITWGIWWVPGKIVMIGFHPGNLGKNYTSVSAIVL